MNAPIIPEHVILLQIMEYLTKECNCYIWRNSTGAFKHSYFNPHTGKYRETFYRMGHKGLPDIIGVAPDGKLIGIEVKTQSGKVSPDQKKVLDELKSRGCWAFVARSLDYVKSIFRIFEKGGE